MTETALFIPQIKHCGHKDIGAGKNVAGECVLEFVRRIGPYNMFID